MEAASDFESTTKANTAMAGRVIDDSGAVYVNDGVHCRQWARRVAVRSAATTTVVTGNGMPSRSTHAAVVPGTHKAAVASTAYRQSNIAAAAAVDAVTERGPSTTIRLSPACKMCL